MHNETKELRPALVLFGSKPREEDATLFYFTRGSTTTEEIISLVKKVEFLNRSSRFLHYIRVPKMLNTHVRTLSQEIPSR